MKIAHAIEGGLAGATTLGLLEKALHNNKTKAPNLKMLTNPGIIKKLKRKGKKKGGTKMYIELAKEVLAAGAYYGVARLGDKKSVVLRGALLGVITGLCMAFINEHQSNKTNDTQTDEAKFKEQLLTVALYTAGGLIAGAAIKKFKKGRKKK